MTELALINLTRPETASDPDALVARMDRLERRMGKPGEIPVSPKSVAQSAPEPVAKNPVDTAETAPENGLDEAAAPLIKEEESVDPPESPAIDISFDQLQKIWPGLFGGLRDVLGARRWAFFREAVPAGVDGNTIILEVAHEFHLTSLEQDDAVSSIVATKASDLFGSPVKVRFRAKAKSPSPRSESERVDLSELEDRPSVETDPTALLAAELGAEVVDE